MKDQIVTPISSYLRSSFLAGLFAAIPITITVVCMIWAWDLLGGPLNWVMGKTEVATGSWGLLKEALSESNYEKFVAPFLGLCILIVAVLLLGILTRSIIGRWALNLFETIVARVPLVGLLYTSVKQLIQAFIGEDAKVRFQSAVLVQFPMKGSWVIGFVTGSANNSALGKTFIQRAGPELSGEGLNETNIVTVFVPTTPLPTQGFTLVLPRSETLELNIPVQDAIQLVISGGIVGKGPSSESQRAAEMSAQKIAEKAREESRRGKAS